MAGLIIICYALILSLAPQVRNHSNNGNYSWGHWLGVIVWILAYSVLNRLSINKMPNRDPFLIPIIGLLSGIGLMTIWRLYPSLGLRQTIWLACSAIIMIAGISYPIFLHSLQRYKYLWLILGLLLTALTLIFGSNPGGSGPALWLNFIGIHFQPSELLKLLLITFLAGYFTERISITLGNIESLFPHLIITLIAILLLVFQRDLGTAAIFLLLYLSIFYSVRGKKIILWFTPLLILILGLVGFFFLDIVRLRIETWLKPFADTTGASFQIIQSLIAAAEGNLIGTGVGLGSPTLVPVAVSDFIFSAITEELGFLGAMLVIGLIILLLYRGTKIALSTKKAFHKYLALGLVYYFGIQSILIIGGNIGFLPLTGVTLPFISYGGSSLLISFIALTILLVISNQNEDKVDYNLQTKPQHIIISGMLIAGLIIEILTSSLISFWFGPSLVDRPDNTRWVIHDLYSPRGDILDRDNQIIISNAEGNGRYERISYHIPLNPVLGYTNALYGQTAIEESMYPYLRGYEGNSYNTVFWHDLIYNQPPEGLDVRLTLDLDLQQMTDDLLTNVKDDSPAAAVMMNADSGEILVMASHPYFDAGNLEEEWDTLIQDQDAPLINRTTQGKYPPGSALLPFVAGTQIDIIYQYSEPEDFLTYTEMNDLCALPLYSNPSWQSMLINGCQNVQLEFADKTGPRSLMNLYQDLGLFSAPNLPLDIPEADTPDISEPTAFYLGSNFHISPIQMAIAASALSNNGLLPEPRLVNAHLLGDGTWSTFPSYDENKRVFSPDITSQITDLFSTQDGTFWGVTSIVINEEEEPITWFIGGTPADWQGDPFVIAIVLEDDAPEIAASIGISLLESVINFSN